MAYEHKVERQPGVAIHRLVSDADPAEYIEEVKSEAERRILVVAPLWKQINAINDREPEIPTKIKAIRNASDLLESLIEAMTSDELEQLDVSTWEGWPND